MSDEIISFSTSGLGETISQINELSKAQRDLEKFLRDTAKAFEAEGLSANNAKKAAQALTEAIGVNAQTFAQLNKRQKELAEGSKLIEATLKTRAKLEKESAKNAAELVKNNLELSKAYKGNQSAIDSLNRAFDGNVKAANNAVKAYQELKTSGQSLSQIQATLSQNLGLTEKQFQAVSKSSDSLDRGLKQIGTASAAVGTGITLALGNAGKEFATFDTAIRQTAVKAGDSGSASIKKLTDEVIRLGIETTKTPEEIAKITTTLATAGFSVDEITQALNGVVKSSEATGESLNTTADVIAKTIRGFGKNASEANDVADLLVVTANATNTSVSSLGESLKFVANTAQRTGQPLQDVLVSLGLLGDAALQGGQGGRNLSRALENLQLAASGANTEFSNLVRGNAKRVEAFNLLKADVVQANGALKPLNELLPILKSRLNGLAKEDKDILFNALFGTEGGRAIGTLLSATDQRIAEVQKRIAGFAGETDRSSKALTEGLGGSFKLLESSVSTLNIKLGELVAIGLEPLARAATGVINLFVNLPQPIQGAIVGIGAFTAILTTAIAAVAAYEIAKKSLVATELLAATQFIASTAAVAAETVAKLANEKVTLAMIPAIVGETTARGAYNVVLQATIAGTKAATVATLGFVKSLLPLLPLLIAVGAGIAAYKFLLNAKEQKEFNDELQNLEGTFQGNANAANELANKTKQLNAKLAEGKGITQQQIADAEKLIKINEGQINALTQELEAKKALKPANEEQKNAQLASIVATESMIRALQNQNQNLRTTIDAKANDVRATEKQKATVKDQTEIIKDNTKAYTENLKAIADRNEVAAKRVKEDADTARKRALEDEIALIKQRNDAEAQQVQDTGNKAIANQEKANQEAIQQTELDFERNQLQPLQKQFEENLNNLKLENERKINAETEAFNKTQAEEKRALEKQLQNEERAFNQSQNSEKRAFEQQLRNEEKAANSQFDAEQKAIDRQLQLEDAKTQAEKDRLKEQFKEEDKKAARRAELEAELNAKKEAFELALQAKKDAFELAQQQKKQAFDDSQNEKKRLFEEQQNQTKAAFEDQLNLKKQENEKALGIIKEQQDQQLADKKLQFEKTVLQPFREQLEEQIAEKKKQLETQVNAIKKQGEDEINARNRQFEDEQRKLDRQYEDQKAAREKKLANDIKAAEKSAALEIEALKDSRSQARIQNEKEAYADLEKDRVDNSPNNKPSSPTVKPKARKSGGSVVAGDSYVVGEKEPELFVPNQSGVILNRKQALDNLDLLMRVGQPKMISSPIPGYSRGISDDLLKAILEENKKTRKVIESRDPEIAITLPAKQLNDSPRGIREQARLIRTIQRYSLNL